MASSPDASDKQSPHQIIELQHFTHQHVLLYGDADAVGNQRCAMCPFMTDNDDGVFSCKECNFFIHKSCSEAPRYIHNSLHPMHPLELFRNERNEDYKFISCRSCEFPIYEFGYKCSSSSTTTVCDFNLDIKCATKNTFDPKGHQHSFIDLKPTLFTCDACGVDERTKCVSCMCSICQLQIHPKCRRKFPLSSYVRQRMHGHVLKLCFSFQIDFDFSNKFCKICSNKMNNVLCLYQCNKGCAYIAHLSCATSRDYWIENIDHEEEDEEVELEEIDTVPEEVITHFSHPHSLILSNIEPTYEAGYVCHGCVRPIISAPFYTCHSQKCTFFLHKQCSQLPTTFRSPIHQHPLVLKDFLDLDVQDIIIGGFTCQACKVRCNGFAYECGECYYDYKFDVECTLLGDTLNHASHKCTLTLVSTDPKEENRCIACDSTFSDAFWCEDCNYFLDLKCAAFPITIGHDCPTGTEWTVKPLKLTYNCIEHAGGQYYCDLCAETRGKDLWFYHCEDCRGSIHPECLLGDGRLMYGKSYNIDGHCHTLCVTKKPQTDPLCDTCRKPCQHSPLVFCPTCKVYFHDDLKCCGMMPSSLYKPIRNYSYGVPSSPKDYFMRFVTDAGCQSVIPFIDVAIKKHPLHPDHPLVLNSFLDLPCNGEVGFICYGCDAFCNRFAYTCLACKFFLDVWCSLLSDTHVHESHPSCTLTLMDKKKGERKCQACNSDCSSCMYICDECNFQLGLRCVSLPKAVMNHHHCSKHEWKIRPHHLMYVAATDDQDGSGEYECGYCRRPGSKKEWYYYCKDCGGSTHVRCSTVTTNFTKNGIEYQAYNHFHNLITVTIRINSVEKCAVCKEEIKEPPVVYCRKCCVYFHGKCCRGLRRV